MRDETSLALRPDLFGQLAATDPFQGRARRLYERGQVLAVNGNQADIRVGYDARNNPLDLKEVPIVSGYIPRVGDWVAIQYEAGHSGAPWVAGPSMAADESEDTPGIGVFSVSSEEPADPPKSTVYFHEPASTWRGWNGAAWVDLGGGGGGLHNSLPDLQGGAAGQYYHLTAAQWNALVGNMPFGAGAVLYGDSSGYVADDADNFSWDATDKRLGIGTSSPEVQFHMVAEDANAWMRLDAIGDSASHAPLIQYFKSAGAIAAPSAISSGDYLFTVRAYGYGDAWGQEGYRFLARADGDWSATNRGTYWYVYGVHPGTTALASWLIVRDGCHRFPNGTAEKPTISFQDYTTKGMFSYSAATIAFATGGLMRGSFNSYGLAILGAGHAAFECGSGYMLDARTSIDARTGPLFYNESSNASGALRLYLVNSGGGDNYVCHRVTASGSKWWSYGVDYSESQRFVWSTLDTLGTYDRMRLERTGVWWLYPHSPSLTVDGQAAMDSYHETFRWRMGTMQCLGASLLDTARVADAHVHSSGGELAETAISANTIDSTFSVSGNSVRVVAKGTAMVNPKGAGGGATMHIKFRIEGTNVLDLVCNPPQSTYAVWIHYEFSFDATLRGSTSWMISNVKAEYAQWQQVGNPWPCTFTPAFKRYGRDTAFTVSGDVTSQVRCSITNAAPDSSFITVAEHKAGLEQL